jgi:small-conductance mechanosensitive channel
MQNPFLIAFVGLLIYWVYMISKAKTEKKNAFAWKIFFQRNTFPLILSVLSVIALLMIQPWFESVLVSFIKKNVADVDLIDNIQLVIALAIGYFNSSLFKTLITTLKMIFRGLNTLIRKAMEKIKKR